jgi:hypothetical protein
MGSKKRGLFVLHAQAGDVVADIFEDIRQPLDAVKDVKHPEGIQKQEENDDRDVNGLRHDGPFEGGGPGDLVIRVDDMEHIDEPEQKDHEQDDLEKHEVKMAHQPLRREIVPIPYFSHEIFVGHFALLSEYFNGLFGEINKY